MPAAKAGAQDPPLPPPALPPPAGRPPLKQPPTRPGSAPTPVRQQQPAPDRAPVQAISKKATTKGGQQVRPPTVAPPITTAPAATLASQVVAATQPHMMQVVAANAEEAIAMLMGPTPCSMPAPAASPAATTPATTTQIATTGTIDTEPGDGCQFDFPADHYTLSPAGAADRFATSNSADGKFEGRPAGGPAGSPRQRPAVPAYHPADRRRSAVPGHEPAVRAPPAAVP